MVKIYKVVLWRYGRRIIREFDTLIDANEEFDSAEEGGSAFTECILDSDDTILRDGMQSVIGIGDNRKGSKYKYSH